MSTSTQNELDYNLIPRNPALLAESASSFVRKYVRIFLVFLLMFCLTARGRFLGRYGFGQSMSSTSNLWMMGFRSLFSSVYVCRCLISDRVQCLSFSACFAITDLSGVFTRKA